ncbi:MAG: hypothetical protein COB23_06050 [Methylophaga sp.]|nr:MAG: hypothetical protein COB23_06050 [Methylophaga sp.]
MKTYKQFTHDIKVIEQTNEGLLFAVAIERKLKSALTAVHSTNDIAKKIDILMKTLHFSLGSMAYQLQKSRKFKK